MRLRTPEWMWSLSRRLHRKGLRRTARITKMLNYLAHRTLLPAEAMVGDGLILEHYGLGVVIHPSVRIGNDCRIYHHVTIAGETAIDSEAGVRIGDRVTIGVNAVILPRSDSLLSIGDDAIIGAGAVVTGDVPAGAVMVGVPARILRYQSHATECNEEQDQAASLTY